MTAVSLVLPSLVSLLSLFPFSLSFVLLYPSAHFFLPPFLPLLHFPYLSYFPLLISDFLLFLLLFLLPFPLISFLSSLCCLLLLLYLTLSLLSCHISSLPFRCVTQMSRSRSRGAVWGRIFVSLFSDSSVLISASFLPHALSSLSSWSQRPSLDAPKPHIPVSQSEMKTQCSVRAVGGS